MSIFSQEMRRISLPAPGLSVNELVAIKLLQRPGLVSVSLKYTLTARVVLFFFFF